MRLHRLYRLPQNAASMHKSIILKHHVFLLPLGSDGDPFRAILACAALLTRLVSQSN